MTLPPLFVQNHESLRRDLVAFYRARLRKAHPRRDQRAEELAEQRLQGVGILRLTSVPFWTRLRSDRLPGNVNQRLTQACHLVPAPPPLPTVQRLEPRR